MSTPTCCRIRVQAIVFRRRRVWTRPAEVWYVVELSVCACLSSAAGLRTTCTCARLTAADSQKEIEMEKKAPSTNLMITTCTSHWRGFAFGSGGMSGAALKFQTRIKAQSSKCTMVPPMEHGTWHSPTGRTPDSPTLTLTGLTRDRVTRADK